MFRYTVAIGRPQHMRGLVSDFVDKTLGGSVSPFVAYLADAKDLSPSDIEELRRLVEQIGRDAP